MTAATNPPTRPPRDKERIFANTREMLTMAQRGLADCLGSEPQRRRPGLMNLFTYGRSVTMAMQTMKHADPSFADWWAPLQARMARDPLMCFFNETRTGVVHEGELATQNHTVIGANGPIDLCAVARELSQLAPPNTVGTFFGDHLGGNGWRVKMPDGNIESVYVQLPDTVDIHSTLLLENPPTEHYGTFITDTSVANLGHIYCTTLAGMVEEFIKRFTE